MAQELRRPLHELLGWPGPLTHRQFEAWEVWLDIRPAPPAKRRPGGPPIVTKENIGRYRAAIEHARRGAGVQSGGERPSRVRRRPQAEPGKEPKG